MWQLLYLQRQCAWMPSIPARRWAERILLSQPSERQHSQHQPQQFQSLWPQFLWSLSRQFQCLWWFHLCPCCWKNPHTNGRWWSRKSQPLCLSLLHPQRSPRPWWPCFPRSNNPVVALLPETQPLVTQQTPVAPAPGPCQPWEILSLKTPFSDCFYGDTCAPRYTAPATELTTTDSCTETRAIPCTSTAELATLASLTHSVPDGDASSSLLAPKVAEEPSVSSAATTTTPTGEPSWLPAEEQLEELEAWLSHLPDELQAPPSPKPAKVVSRIEAAGGLQSKATGSSKSEVMSGRYLRSRLRSLDAAVNCLQKIRRDLQESVMEAHKQEVLDKEVENQELRRWVPYLEAQLQRSQTGHSTLPTKVGDLQNLSTTRAFVLFPNIGRTAVYSLEPEDVRLLDLANRSEPFSCDHL